MATTNVHAAQDDVKAAQERLHAIAVAGAELAKAVVGAIDSDGTIAHRSSGRDLRRMAKQVIKLAKPGGTNA
jgi:hypothetical protein